MFLLSRFHEFYQETLRLKQRVARGSWVFDTEREDGRTGSEAEPSPTAVWRTLYSLLERQALEATRNGGDFAVELYRRAQYAMAALADEIFLHLDWAGREAWRSNLLEARLFGSHHAGEELFERMEELLRDRDDVQTELARIYLQVLALGFQGRYRGRPDGEHEIESYRRRLFRFLAGHDPRVMHGDERLMPQAYESTLDQGRPSKLLHLRPWLWALACVVSLWLGASHVLWRHETRGLDRLVQEILDTGQRLSLPREGSAP